MQCIYEVDERTSRVHSTLQDLNDYGDFFHRKKGTSKILLEKTFRIAFKALF